MRGDGEVRLRARRIPARRTRPRAALPAGSTTTSCEHAGHREARPAPREGRLASCAFRARARLMCLPQPCPCSSSSLPASAAGARIGSTTTASPAGLTVSRARRARLDRRTVYSRGAPSRRDARRSGPSAVPRGGLPEEPSGLGEVPGRTHAAQHVPHPGDRGQSQPVPGAELSNAPAGRRWPRPPRRDNHRRSVHLRGARWAGLPAELDGSPDHAARDSSGAPAVRGAGPWRRMPIRLLWGPTSHVVETRCSNVP